LGLIPILNKNNVKLVIKLLQIKNFFRFISNYTILFKLFKHSAMGLVPSSEISLLNKIFYNFIYDLKYISSIKIKKLF